MVGVFARTDMVRQVGRQVVVSFEEEYEGVTLMAHDLIQVKGIALFSQVYSCCARIQVDHHTRHQTEARVAEGVDGDDLEGHLWACETEPLYNKGIGSHQRWHGCMCGASYWDT